jgi:hypothetical protein
MASYETISKILMIAVAAYPRFRSETRNGQSIPEPAVGYPG